MRSPVFLLLALPLLAPAAVPARAATVSGPRTAIEETVAEVLAVLKDDAITGDERARRVERIAYARFDFPAMSRLVLARNWKRLTPAQKEEFQREFKRFLANNYRARIDGYDQEQVDVLEERKEPRGDVTVRTRIAGGEYDGTNIDYRLRNRTGTWLVIDVVIEGISLVSNYRDQFREIISEQGGVGALLERIHEKNESIGGAPAIVPEEASGGLSENPGQEPAPESEE